MSGSANLYYFSSTSVHRVARLLVFVAAVLAITGPTFALCFEKRVVVRLALIVCFSVVFGSVLLAMTNCKNQEMFAIIAA